MATEEKPPASSPWEPLVFMVLLLGGLLGLLWVRGGLKDLNSKDILVAPPTTLPSSATSSYQGTGTYTAPPFQPDSTNQNTQQTPPLNP